MSFFSNLFKSRELNYYVDEKGYRRFKDSKKLVHRWVAKKYIYDKNRDKFPLHFSKYQVHHKNGNKQYNHASNLELLTESEHRKIHGLGLEGFKDILKGIAILIIFAFLIVLIMIIRGG